MTATPKRRAPRRKPRSIPRLSGNADTRSMQRRVARGRAEGAKSRYVLRLYVTGITPASARAIERVRSFCEDHLRGRYDLQIIDIHQLPALAKDEQIVATPTLIKVLPAPLRRFIGDLSKTESILFGMDLRENG